MLAFIQGELLAPGAAEKFGVIGLLAIAVIVLWREWRAERRQKEELIAELTAHLATHQVMAEAFERLRESVEALRGKSRG